MVRTPRVGQLRGEEISQLLPGKSANLYRHGRHLHLNPWCRPGGYPVRVTFPELGEHRICGECLPNSNPALERLLQEELAVLAAEELLEIQETGTLWELDDLYDRILIHLATHPRTPSGERLEEALAATKQRWKRWQATALPTGAQRVMLLDAEEVRGAAHALLSTCTRAERGTHRVLVVPEECRSIIEHNASGADAGPYEEDSPAVLETALTLWIDNGELGSEEVLEQARLVHGTT